MRTTSKPNTVRRLTETLRLKTCIGRYSTLRIADFHPTAHSPRRGGPGWDCGLRIDCVIAIRNPQSAISVSLLLVAIVVFDPRFVQHDADEARGIETPQRVLNGRLGPEARSTDPEHTIHHRREHAHAGQRQQRRRTE